MTTWLKNVTPTKSKLSVHVDQCLIEQFKALLTFFQETQPSAEIDHLVESAMADYLHPNKPYMKAYRAWEQEKEAQIKAQQEQEKAAIHQRKQTFLPPSTPSEPEGKLSQDDLLRRSRRISPSASASAEPEADASASSPSTT